jgi:undecaprenyl-diphosphatase
MVIIPIIGANVIELITAEKAAADAVAIPLIIAFTTAFVTGYIACRWMISIVNKGKLGWFALYCAILGLSLILFA